MAELIRNKGNSNRWTIGRDFAATTTSEVVADFMRVSDEGILFFYDENLLGNKEVTLVINSDQWACVFPG